MIEDMYDEDDVQLLDEQYDEDGNISELNFDRTEAETDVIIDDDDKDDISKKDNILEKFRYEIKKQEPYRKEFSVVYKGEFLRMVPMAEINPNRFVVMIDEKLKAVNLTDIA